MRAVITIRTPCGLLAAGLLFSGLASAQTSTWKEGYKQVIPSSTVNGLTPDGMFGEHVNLYTGEVTFTATDVSLPGSNTLDVSYRRKLDMTDQQITRGWVADLPHLEGVYPEDIGWTRKNPFSGATGRCSAGPAAPPNAIGTKTSSWTSSVWDPGEYWSGDFLSLPGAGNEELLKAQSTGVGLPTDGVTYKWVTKSGWRFSCIATAKNDPGEGFLAVAPDGTKYYFDWFASSEEQELIRPGSVGPAPVAPDNSGTNVRGNGNGSEGMAGRIGRNLPGAGDINTAAASPTGYDFLKRKRVLIYPSKVVDRFGNYVDYMYATDSRNPTSIVASDGRTITINYGSPTTVLANGRTWTYAGNTVTLPDGSSWVYDLYAILSDQFDYYEGSSGSLSTIDKACDTPPEPKGLGGIGKTGTVKHPSGAIGTFTFVPVRHGRSYVDRNCIGFTVDSGVYYSYPYRPYVFDTRSLKSKTISGPGLTTATWEYQYGPTNNSWASACASGCAASKYVDVIDPLGEKTRHIFSNRWQVAEGREIATEMYDASGILRQRTDSTYFLTNTGQAYPAQIGLSGNARGDGTSMRFDPLIKSQTVRDGRKFTWEVANACNVGGSTTYCFDAQARPTQIIKSSAPSP